MGWCQLDGKAVDLGGLTIRALRLELALLVCTEGCRCVLGVATVPIASHLRQLHLSVLLVLDTLHGSQLH